MQKPIYTNNTILSNNHSYTLAKVNRGLFLFFIALQDVIRIILYIMTENSKPLKTGYTTGSCATAATAAALDLLLNNNITKYIELVLPSQDTATIKVENIYTNTYSATASVKKYSGDDPDITNGAIISSTVKLNNTEKIRLFAGKEVGTVTKKGLQIPVGEPAINPVPRQMIKQVVSEYTDQGIDITIAVEDGEELAKKTFNPRLGIVGGISIIGTSGIVRPFSHKAIQETVKISIDVATALGTNKLVLVAGHFGMTAAQNLFEVKEDEIIEVSNEWGVALTCAKQKNIGSVLILSHPGKLAKFIDGYFNTHSRSSPSALPIVKRIATRLNINILNESTTVEGIFNELTPEDRNKLATELANQIYTVVQKYSKISHITVILIDMQYNELGNSGDTDKWQRK